MDDDLSFLEFQSYPVDTTYAWTRMSDGSELGRHVKFVAVSTVFFLFKLATAGTAGVRGCFTNGGAVTQMASNIRAESSTELWRIKSEAKTELEALFYAAMDGVIEDGMRNVITEKLPGLLAKYRNSLTPFVISLIDSNTTSPLVAAEVLKMLGRIRDGISHPDRLWVLEHALHSSSPLTRDGAGLGLARLADPAALSYLRAAVQAEGDPQVKADLQLVVDELAELDRNGASSPNHK
jgi:hypothetical protein